MKHKIQVNTDIIITICLAVTPLNKPASKPRCLHCIGTSELANHSFDAVQFKISVLPRLSLKQEATITLG